MKKYDAAKPRKMYWSGTIGGTSVCPECGGSLEGEEHCYLMGIRYSDGETSASMVGCEGGYFCSACPTIVLDNAKFEDMAERSAGGPSMAYTVLGLINMDAVPEEKSHLPFDEKDNPIPLVRFLDTPAIGRKRHETQSRNQRKSARRRNRRKR